VVARVLIARLVPWPQAEGLAGAQPQLELARGAEYVGAASAAVVSAAAHAVLASQASQFLLES